MEKRLEVLVILVVAAGIAVTSALVSSGRAQSARIYDLEMRLEHTDMMSAHAWALALSVPRALGGKPMNIIPVRTNGWWKVVEIEPGVDSEK